MIILLLSATFAFFYGLYELWLWYIFISSPRGEEAEEEACTNEPNDIRIIERNGFFYTSPTQYEDKENSTFEWGVKRFRVEGEGLIEDRNYGKNSDFNDTFSPLRPRFDVEGDDPQDK